MRTLVIILLLNVTTGYIFGVHQMVSHLYMFTSSFKTLFYLLAVFLANLFLISVFFLKSKKVFNFVIFAILFQFILDFTYYYISGEFFEFSQQSIALAEINYLGDVFQLHQTSILVAAALFFLTYLALIELKSRISHVIPLKFILSIFILSLLANLAIVFRTANSTFVPISSIKIVSNLIYGFGYSTYKGPRDLLHMFPKSASAYQNIILIIDESVAGKHLSINDNKKNTTPFLVDMEKRHNLSNFGLAVSAANCSAASNIILMTNSQPQRLPDRSGEYVLKKSNIFQYMKNAGFKTAYISGQSNEKKFQNHMSKHDLQHIDYFYQGNQHSGTKSLVNAPEQNIADELSEFLKTDQKHFAFVVKKGSHFGWESTYPESHSYFLPKLTKSTNYNKKNKHLAINSYSNSIRYNVDLFFKNLLQRITLKNTVIFYTSDHGQSILENSSLTTHCTARTPPPSQGIVPFFTIHDTHDLTFNDLQKDVYSHFNIVPTILLLSGYTNDQFEGIEIFRTTDKQKIDYFYSGDIFGRAPLHRTIVDYSSRNVLTAN
ncbi:MAG: hypothetical protein CMB82_01240 [Flammeovirgaceae bacterium]|nr:hypothetical protein [Flammeovirgaceae bacterium]